MTIKDICQPRIWCTVIPENIGGKVVRLGSALYSIVWEVVLARSVVFHFYPWRRKTILVSHKIGVLQCQWDACWRRGGRDQARTCRAHSRREIRTRRSIGWQGSYGRLYCSCIGGAEGRSRWGITAQCAQAVIGVTLRRQRLTHLEKEENNEREHCE